MKKTILFACVLLVQTISMAQVTSGLVAKYSFNNGTANDEVATNHGTVNGATLTTDRFGNTGHAHAFDAVNSARIVVPHNSAIDFNNASSFTIAFWMKTSATNGSNATPVTKQTADGSWNGYTFFSNGTDGGYCNGPGTFNFYSASGAFEDACADSLVAYDTTEWKFVTGIYNGSVNESYLYIDGHLQADTGHASGTISNTSDLIFGCFSSFTVAFYSGKLDDIRIYNRALNALEIDSLLHEPNPAGVGIHENPALANTVTLYPNPTSGIIRLSGSFKCVVTDVTGKIIVQASNVHLLDLSDQPQGIYFVSVTDVNGTLLQKNKIVKQ